MKAVLPLAERDLGQRRVAVATQPLQTYNSAARRGLGY